MNVKEIGDLVISAVRSHVAKAIAPQSERIDELVRRVAALESGAAKANAQGESLERRVSRHAEHLGRLETRTRAAERGTTPRVFERNGASR